VVSYQLWETDILHGENINTRPGASTHECEELRVDVSSPLRMANSWTKSSSELVFVALSLSNGKLKERMASRFSSK